MDTDTQQAVALLAALGVGAVYVTYKLTHPVGVVPVQHATPPLRGGVVVQILEAIDAVLGHRLLPVPAEDTLKRARALVANPENFGDQTEPLRGLEIWLDGISRAPTSLIGRVFLRMFCGNIVATRKSVIDYVDRNPSIRDIPIRRPIIITGLYRTGSTLLYSLLACDPNTRGTYLWEIYHATGKATGLAPPANEQDWGEQHPRYQALQKSFSKLRGFLPHIWKDISASHPLMPEALDEDLYILWHQFLNPQFGLMASEGGQAYEDWLYDPTNKEAAYLYHKRFLQMLTSGKAPKSHWTLKAPNHGLFLDEINKNYPDASLIFTHRTVEQTVPSFCRLLESTVKMFYRDSCLDRRKVGRYGLHHMKEIAARVTAFQKSASASDMKRVQNVSYKQLMADPIAEVRRLYEQLGYEYSAEFEKNMRQWLDDNPQGKHGRASYSLADFGISQEDIDLNFADYNKQFL
eukprot:NODE_1221_length_1630_cov_31.189753_g1086_i0.p1 GENE.NODE_1221_length_1630_cov_31.189753_g1086_i0~~NODE_1221_length_1630_cov_31.189753_g1086_i0.p1  ORF type:complete len:507 (-),score=86.87 NODE_1221_length_1630_cov_31.189753_g1086_i0:110-1498(-)